MELPQNVYDTMAWIGRICLPALAVFYGTIGKIWNLPFTEQIPLTLTAMAVLINALLKKASDDYFDKREIVDATVDRNVDKG